MRRKLWIRVILGILFAVGLWAGILFLIRYREMSRSNRELTEVVAEIEATDPRWRWEQILEDYPDIPPEEASGPPSIKLLPGNSSIDIDSQWVIDVDAALEEYPSNHIIRDSLACELWTIWEAYLPHLEIAEQVSRCRHVGQKIELAPDVFSTMLEYIQGHREAVRLLQLDARVRLESGRPERALSRVHEIFAVAHLLRDEPFIISQLVRVAIMNQGVKTLECVLARHSAEPQDEAILRTLRQRLAQAGQEEFMIVGLRGERASGDRLFRNIAEGVFRVTDIPQTGWETPPTKRNSLDTWFADSAYRSAIGHDHAIFLRFVTEAIQTSELPTWERESNLSDIPFPSGGTREKLSTMLIPAVNRTNEAELRSLALMRGTELAIACELYRLKHGRWPVDIDELKTELPDGVPLDPWTGKPMTFVRRADGLVIPRSEAEPSIKSYQVPTPGIDAGQETDPEEPPYFRLWNPEYRSLPALPSR